MTCKIESLEREIRKIEQSIDYWKSQDHKAMSLEELHAGNQKSKAETDRLWLLTKKLMQLKTAKANAETARIMMGRKPSSQTWIDRYEKFKKLYEEA